MNKRVQPTALTIGVRKLLGNHVPKLIEAMSGYPGHPATVNHIDVFHDDWCALLNGTGACNCDPDVQVMGVAR
jgi:hypothetical protein